MKMMRRLILSGLALMAAGSASVVLAQTTATKPATTPVVTPHEGTAGLPAEIATLITSFDKTRDAYLTTQAALLGQLKNATTATERDQIRDSLQSNRNAFMVDLKTYRTELKDDLVALKGKITHQEMLRILDAAYDLGNLDKGSGPTHHRGSR
jgi:hypothetical protein